MTDGRTRAMMILVCERMIDGREGKGVKGMEDGKEQSEDGDFSCGGWSGC